MAATRAEYSNPLIELLNVELPQMSSDDLRALMERQGWNLRQTAEIMKRSGQRTTLRYLDGELKLDQEKMTLLLLAAGEHPTLEIRRKVNTALSKPKGAELTVG